MQEQVQEQVQETKPELTPEEIENQMFEEAAALAGYSEEGLKPPEITDEADPAPPVVAEDTGSKPPVEVPEVEAAPPDPFADATPEQIQALAQLKEDRAKFEHDSMSNRNRVSALQKKVNELEKKQEAAPPAEPAAPAEPAPTLDTADTEVDLSEFKEDFPEIYKAVNGIYQNQMGQMQKQFDQKLSQITEQVQDVAQPVERLQEKEQEDSRRHQLAALKAAHPDFVEIQNTKEFWEWVEVQSDGLKALAGSVAAADNIALLNIYKSQGTVPVTPPQADPPPALVREPDVALPRVNSGGRPQAGVAPNDENAAWKYWEDNWDKV